MPKTHDSVKHKGRTEGTRPRHDFELIPMVRESGNGMAQAVLKVTVLLAIKCH